MNTPTVTGLCLDILISDLKATLKKMISQRYGARIGSRWCCRDLNVNNYSFRNIIVGTLVFIGTFFPIIRSWYSCVAVNRDIFWIIMRWNISVVGVTWSILLSSVEIFGVVEDNRTL